MAIFKRNRTLKRRIVRSMYLSVLITVLLMSIMSTVLVAFLVKGMGLFGSYFAASTVANQMQSEEFLSRMGDADSLIGIDVESKEFKTWLYGIQRTFKVRFENEIPENLQEEAADKKAIKFEENVVIMEIDINGKEVYTTESYERMEAMIKTKTGTYPMKDVVTGKMDIKKDDMDKVVLELKSEKNNFWHKMIQKYINTETTIPLLEKSGKVVGYVSVMINPDMLGIIMAITTLIIVLAAFIAQLISKIIARIISIPIVEPLKRLQSKLDEMLTGEESACRCGYLKLEKTYKEIEDISEVTNKIIDRMAEHYRELEEHKEELESQKDELEAQNMELEGASRKLKEINCKVEEKNSQLENIINNVGQGFMLFDNSLMIKPEHSKECKNIFKIDITSLKLSRILYPSDEKQQNFMNDIFKKLFENPDEMTKEVYMPLLPVEEKIGEKFVSIEYNMVKENGVGTKDIMMVIVTDITNNKMLEEKMDEERKNLKMVVKAVSNHETFLDGICEQKEFDYDKVREVLNSFEDLNKGVSEVYRRIHTLKGSFSQFAMETTVKKLHEIESEISNLKEKDVTDVEEVIELLKRNDFEVVLNEDIEVFKAYLGDNFLSKKEVFVVEKEKILNIERKMANILSKNEYSLLIPDIKKLRYKPIKDMIKNYVEYVETLSGRLNKNIRHFEIEGDEVLVDVDEMADFSKSLVHIFRNAVYHGIEDSEIRVEMEKSEIGSIRCEIKNMEDEFAIIISDDGKGIDLNSVKEKALEREIFSEEEILDMKNDEVVDIIFMDEFSTNDDADDISGRGVGLAAVKGEVEKLGGKIEVSTVPWEGTEFKIILPLAREQKSSDVMISSFMKKISDKTVEFINENTNMELEKFEMVAQKTDKVILNKVTALINIRGVINSIVIFSVNEALARKLLKGIIIENLSETEEIELLDDIIAECANIILGNSMEVFESVDDVINIGTPTIMGNEGASIKYTESEIISYNIRKGEYYISLSMISMDQYSLEGEELWQEY